MSTDPDVASILFPDDAPQQSRQEPPTYFKVAQSEAEQRLMGNHGKGTDATANPSDDVASKLFSTESADPDYDNLVLGELEQHTLTALKDGDEERAEALRAATTALADDFRQHGTDAADLSEAFEIVRHSAGLEPPTPEQLEASFADGMAAVERDGISADDLNAARRFINDLEIRSPGVKASLEAHGAGNDPRLVRAAVREARKRGY